MSPRQTTIARPVSTDGTGLHTGARCSLTLQPADPDAGIAFISPSGVRVPATAEYVTDTRRCTALGLANSRISTVEHLLSAVYGLGIDNVEVVLTGEELPACDGSAQEWVALLRRAGVRRLEAPRREFGLDGVVWVSEGEATAMASPASALSLSVGIDFGDALVGRQALWLPVTPAHYAGELAPARTFCFQHEVDALLAAGLARGGTETNAIVVRPEGYSLALRFPDEPVRHKALDAVGDLALVGARLRAQVTLVRPSHRLNVALARALRERYLGQAG